MLHCVATRSHVFDTELQDHGFPQTRGSNQRSGLCENIGQSAWAPAAPPASSEGLPRKRYGDSCKCFEERASSSHKGGDYAMLTWLRMQLLPVLASDGRRTLLHMFSWLGLGLGQQLPPDMGACCFWLQDVLDADFVETSSKALLQDGFLVEPSLYSQQLQSPGTRGTSTPSASATR